MKKTEVIVNNADAFKPIVKFCKKYFNSVKIIRNKYSKYARMTQNSHILIVFTNRDVIFSIRWCYSWCKLYIGDISKSKLLSLPQYTFTKIGYDDCCPIEQMNNSNILFWENEIVNSFNDTPIPINPFRIPITLKSESRN
jgi:hypothetical protein